MVKSLIIILITLFQINSISGQTELNREVNLTKNQFDDRYASYSPDGKWIVFESNRGDHWNLFLMDSSGHNEQQLTTSKNDNRRPTWHPSGNKVLFESNRSGAIELYSIKVKNKKVKKISTPIDNESFIFATYSPNGKEIAVSSKESENKSNIVILKKNGQLIKRLTHENCRNYYPKWSNDGKEIIYFSRRDTDNQDDEIYRLAVDGGSPIRLTNWPKHNFCPSWSSDNKKIAYVTSMDGTRPEIYVMDSDGNNPIRITNNDDGETLPNWHPRENKILVTGYRDGNFEILELDLDF